MPESGEFYRVLEVLGSLKEAISTLKQALRDQQQRETGNQEASAELKARIDVLRRDVDAAIALAEKLDAQMSPDTGSWEPLAKAVTDEHAARADLWKRIGAAIGGGAGAAGLVELARHYLGG